MTTAELSAVVASDDSFLEKARELASRFAIPLVESPSANWRTLPGSGLVLYVTGDGLALAMGGRAMVRPLLIDFSSKVLIRRARQAGNRNEALARAIAVGKLNQPRVVDATAGLARDAFLLAFLGCQVLMFERNPIIALLLDDALKRGRSNPDELIAASCKRMDLNASDARTGLVDLTSVSGEPTVLYLDPMFSERGSAAAGREMVYLQRLHGQFENDDEELMNIALSCPWAARTVVKRPVNAIRFSDVSPNHVVAGKSIRFDVYLNNSVR